MRSMCAPTNALKEYFIDAHVHIGRASAGQAIKISASPNLTVAGILEEAHSRKGIDVVGIIDAVTPPVMADIRGLVSSGVLLPLPGGGLSYAGRVTLFLGAEVEVAGPAGGAAHFGIFVPTLEALSELAGWLAARQTNPTLSSQRLVSGSARDLAEVCRDLDGIFIVNHAFTPHKGLYGSCVAKMPDMVPHELVTAVELGLSADTAMADRISELTEHTFVTNSDAHSLPKMAREYHVAKLCAPTFSAYKHALQRTGRERIIRNVGLWPTLGKYHRTACRCCGTRLDEPTAACPNCGSQAKTVGVWERLLAVADRQDSVSPPHRPAYVHQVPLEFIPGLGAQKLAALFASFQTEMNILHRTTVDDLAGVVGEHLAHLIELARTGELTFSSGAGGRYGKVVHK